MENIRKIYNSIIDLSKFFSDKKILSKIVLKVTILLNIIHIITYFENLTIKLHVLYALNTYVKFCINRILFTI